MLAAIIWTAIFSITTAGSITLLGDKSLISGNLLDWTVLVRLLFNWKFIVAMLLAICARLSFIFVNNAILKIPSLADSATTVTAFITSITYVLIIISNYVFLGERLSMSQVIGATIMMIGMIFMFK